MNVRTLYLEARETHGVRTSLHLAAVRSGKQFAEVARELGFSEEFIKASAQHYVSTITPERRAS